MHNQRGKTRQTGLGALVQAPRPVHTDSAKASQPGTAGWLAFALDAGFTPSMLLKCDICHY